MHNDEREESINNNGSFLNNEISHNSLGEEDLNYSNTMSQNVSSDLVVNNNTEIFLNSISFEKIKNINILPDEHLFCQICKKLSLILAQCKKCDNYFCNSCINHYTSNNNGKCFTGTCEKYKAKQNIDKIVKSLLSKLVLECNFSDCVEEVPYDNYINHVTTCEFRKQKCTNCSEQIIFKSYEEHFLTCPLSKVICELGCKEDNIFLKDYEEHKIKCDYLTVICEDGCHNSYLQKDFPNHYENCDLVIVTCNNCKEAFTKGSFPSHNCFDVFQTKYDNMESNHLREKEKLIREKENFISDNKSMVKTLREKDNIILKLNSKVYELEEKIESSLQEKQTVLEENQYMQKKLKLHENEDDYLKILNNLENEITKIKEENCNLKVFIENNNLTINELRKKINLKNFNPYNSQLNETNEKVINKLEETQSPENNYYSFKDEPNNSLDGKGSPNISQILHNVNNTQLNISDNNINTSSQKLNQQNVSKISIKNYTCAICTQEVSIKTSTKCKICKDVICLYCKDNCFICFQNFCSAHIKNCEKCTNTVCRGDISVCDGCNSAHCRKCFDEENICDICNWQIDPVNKDKLILVENDGYVCRTYSTANCLSSLAVGNKVFKNGLHKWEMKIKSPICKLTDFGVLILEKEDYTFIFEKNLINKQGRQVMSKSVTSSSNSSDKIFAKLNKISVKELAPQILNKQFNSSFIFTLDLKGINDIRKFSVDIDSKSYEQEIKNDAKFFLPYFVNCNNYIILRHIFILSNN
jgi:hypothetical protein